MEAVLDPDEAMFRFIAEDGTGWAAGMATARHAPWDKEGEWSLLVVVDSDARGRGTGTLSFDAALAAARESGAASYRSFVSDGVPEARTWAERRGFSIARHEFVSVLDMRAFDERRFAGAVARVTDDGIRFFSWSEVERTHETERRLYDLDRLCARDVPGNEDSPAQPFDAYIRQTLDAPWFLPEALVIAADGDCWVGMTSAAELEGGRMFQQFTAVRRKYRGRGIAFALKLVAIRAFESRGVAHIRTMNDSQNAPMLAINRKLGFQPEPGMYVLERRFP